MSNHKAIVAKVERTEQIPGANTIQIGYVLGERVIINKSTDEGSVGIFFMPDLQLSEEFCKTNNLFRHSDMNQDQSKSGFFEDNRRVRAQPFMKVRSDGFFCPLEYLTYTGHDISALKVGDQFDTLNEKGICCKYISERTRAAMQKNSTKSVKKISVPFFKEHIDTEQFKYNIDKIKVGDLISIQAKRHGTSGRYAHMEVVLDLPKWKQIVNKIAPIFPEKEWQFVVGTRRVVLKSQDQNKTGFHGPENFRFEILNQLKPFLEKGMEVYGEIVGFANDNSIMPKHSTAALKNKEFTKKYGESFVYKYGCPEGTYKFIIYRITYTTASGLAVDFSQSQLVKWCKDRGFEPALDLIQPFVYDGNREALVNLVESLTERPECLTEDYTDPTHINEGVIIRIDSDKTTPLFLKNKSWAFKVCEGIAKEEEVDTEDAS